MDSLQNMIILMSTGDLFLCRNSHESVHSLDPKSLRCVSVHPVEKHYFAVAESKYGRT